MKKQVNFVLAVGILFAAIAVGAIYNISAAKGAPDLKSTSDESKTITQECQPLSVQSGNISINKTANIQLYPPDYENKLVKNALKGSEQKAVISEAREAGMARLAADRQNFRQLPEKTTDEINQITSTRQAKQAQKTKLLPLPAAKSNSAAVHAFPRHQKDIERLSQLLANADNQSEYERSVLKLAAAYVGNGQWDKAKALYKELAGNSMQEGIRETAIANLNILEKGHPQGQTGCKNCEKSKSSEESGKGGVK